MKQIDKLLFALFVAIVTVRSFYIPPAMSFMNPNLAKIFVWHFPCPMIAVSLLVLGAWFGYKHLQTRDLKWDIRSEAANELSYIFSLLTMATGILFSKVQWNAWWQWDPRQTSFLLVLLIYAAYFVLRTAFSDRERRAANSAAFGLAALLPALFLIFVFPRLPQVLSFHPTDSIMKGQIKGEYAIVVTGVMICMTVISVWIYRLRVRAGLMNLESENYDGNQLSDPSGHPTPSGVVRPVRLSSEN